MGRNSRGFLTGITTWWRKKIIAVRHSFYRKRLVRRLTNLAPSILSLDCVGGVMAHDLRLRFNSPTVNLFFESCGDFIDYVADLRYYSQAELCECPYAYEGARRYPVGMLKGNGTLPDIKIHFLHYRSFEEAREKWLERSGRLDFDNLCVVMQVAKLDEGLLERFERLPIPRKVILAYETLPLQSPSIFKMRSLDSFVPGRILDYNGLSGRRYLDDFDYVAFLNDGTIRAQNCPPPQKFRA